ncbi:10945_t:CDS:2 [Funneliformis geosporum]|uniref:13750_t:CDS:1 n=1 Tax=Funneliformis geosporum TaxID=1117311 RepID=A0A9W4SUK2_9GLOM|nr:10945_t:CDS:2 [Funneliformis geosporum]CAI2183743.1 13750_t:CDS:2 [Funneliformis geosporum]
MSELNNQIRRRHQENNISSDNSGNDEMADLENQNRESRTHQEKFENDETRIISHYQKFFREILLYQHGFKIFFFIFFISCIILTMNYSNKKFIYTTTCNFIDEIPGKYDMKLVFLKDLKKVLDNIATYRRVANIVETSPALKSHTHISKDLRYFSDRLLDASLNLNNLYHNGIHMFATFDEEINSMRNRILSDSSFKREDRKYLYDKITFLKIEFQKFRPLFKPTNSSINLVEHHRNKLEASLFIGLRDAEKFVLKHDFGYPSVNVLDSINAREDVRSIKKVLSHLHDTAIYLYKLKKLLMIYEADLFDVSIKLASINIDKNGIFEPTFHDFKYLQYSVGHLKSAHYNFIRKNFLFF